MKPGAGLKAMATSLQALKQRDAGIEATSQGFKLAQVSKLPNLGTRVQAYKLVQGTSYQDKSIFFMLKVKRYLVRREPHKIGFFWRSYF